MVDQQKLSELNKEYETLLFEFNEELKTVNNGSYDLSKISSMQQNLVDKRNEIEILFNQINGSESNST